LIRYRYDFGQALYPFHDAITGDLESGSNVMFHVEHFPKHVPRGTLSDPKSLSEVRRMFHVEHLIAL
jgi:hypothetical protein